MSSAPIAYAVPAPTAPAAALPVWGLSPDLPLSEESEREALSMLAAEGFPKGLARIMVESRKTFGLRHWVVDNSGSMSLGDGQRLVSAGRKTKMISCSRWEELRESLSLCGKFAAVARLPSEFRLINSPAGAPQSITLGSGDSAAELDQLQRLVRSEPGGGTPLCESVALARAMIESCADELRARGQKAVLVVACDGKPTDGNLARVMETLKSLPVWVVVRLCTDEDDVVSFWNGIDEQLELEMDVLDDICGEAKEVCSNNPWLVYGRPLHTAREFGVRHKIFDLLDERSFTVSEMAKFCELIYGVELPHPEVDWAAFETALGKEIMNGPTTWDPMSKRIVPWINIRQLRNSYKQGGCTLC